jgi:hypothetical protein
VASEASPGSRQPRGQPPQLVFLLQTASIGCAHARPIEASLSLPPDSLIFVSVSAAMTGAKPVICCCLMPDPHCFVLSAAGCTIRLQANSQDSFDLLDRYIFPSVPRRQPANEAHDLHIRLEDEDGASRLFVDDVEVASAAHSHELLRKLIDCLDTALVPRLKDLHAVHAGAVLVRGRALLFAGASHSGKSSLVHEFSRRGVVCFSDEYALIDPEGRIHAYPRVLLVRNGGRDQFPVVHGSIAHDPAPVGWIFTLQYASAGSWSVDQVPQSMALLSLLQNTPHELDKRPQMVNAFQRAVNGAACYAGQRGEVADAVDRILKLIERGF